MISPHEHSIVISPIGELDSVLIKEIGKSITESFGFGTENVCLLEDINFALDSERDQYYSTAILDRLSELAPPQAIKLLAVCEVDLFIPILTHVYGEAQLGGKACIISTLRLNEDLPSLNTSRICAQRIIKEAIHELGHTFKLRHCQDTSCGMHYCRTIKDVDHKSHEFCRYCKILLQDEIKRIRKKGTGDYHTSI